MDRAGQEKIPNFEGSKRKIDVDIELAKQRAQEIAARLVNSSEPKRPRLDSSPVALEAPSSVPSAQISYPTFTPASGQYVGLQMTNKKIYIPNGKVGVIIGRGGDMIKNLQLRSGAKIQITRDADADPTSMTRDVELSGTQEQISRAEELINEVIAETDAAGSGSTGNRAVNPVQPGGEQFVMQVPNDKVALIIGKGGETIKNMQTRTGARIQVVPLHLPPGDTSTERSVYISGTNDQIESAKALVIEVISGNRLKTFPSSIGYTQSSYPPASGSWAPPGQPQQQAGYSYAQPGNYSVAPTYYGSYSQQTASWDPSNPSAIPPPPPQNPGYNMYGQPQSQPAPSPPPPAGVSYSYGQVPPPATTAAAATTYNYYQGGYSHQPPTYGQDPSSQAPPQLGYGQPPPSQTDGTASAPAPTSQPTYGAPGVSPKSDTGTTTQAQPSPGYGAGYSQSANGYGAYPSYGASQQPSSYNQAGYGVQMGYGQQQGAQAAAVPPQASYYYGQGGYMSQPQAPAPPPQAGYYPGAYQAQQAPPQSTNGISQPSNYGAEKTEDGSSVTDSGAVAQEAINDVKS